MVRSLMIYCIQRHNCLHHSFSLPYQDTRGNPEYHQSPHRNHYLDKRGNKHSGSLWSVRSSAYFISANGEDLLTRSIAPLACLPSLRPILSFISEKVTALVNRKSQHKRGPALLMDMLPQRRRQDAPASLLPFSRNRSQNSSIKGDPQIQAHNATVTEVEANEQALPEMQAVERPMAELRALERPAIGRRAPYSLLPKGQASEPPMAEMPAVEITASELEATVIKPPCISHKRSR